MITVTVYKSDSQYTGFVVDGHADYAEQGSDIVCSAVSALAITTANAIEAFTEVPFVQDFDEDGGFLQMKFPEGTDEKASLLLDSLVLGIGSIRDQYKENYLTLKVEEV